MTPTRHDPNYARNTSMRNELSKGDNPMAKMISLAAAIVLLTAAWASAGNFAILADAGLVRPQTPVSIKPGTVVKAEYQSNLKTAADTDLEADSLLPEKVSAVKPQVATKPAVAFKERRTRGMAPPPASAREPEDSGGRVAQTETQEVDLEGDLEKDLVLTPPSPQAEERKAVKPKRKGAEKPAPAVETKAPPEKKVEKKGKAATLDKKVTPPGREPRTAQGQLVQKVKPITSNPWSRPAGAYQPPACPVARGQATLQPRVGLQDRGAVASQYMPSDPRPYAGLQPSHGRIVRDGVTVKLAPAAAPQPQEDVREDGAGSDILSTATEILGLPFAFISSLF
jgi:hypothetical protein